LSGDRYDVAVVGASTAGCTAARLFGMRGARVALIERRPALDAYKTVCTHYVQSSATPTIEKLGLAPLLDARGAVRNGLAVWTRHGGWIVTEEDTPYGYSVTRRTLDPMLRQLAAETPGVDLMAGWSAVGLLGGDGRLGASVGGARADAERANGGLGGHGPIAATLGRGDRAEDGLGGDGPIAAPLSGGEPADGGLGGHARAGGSVGGGRPAGVEVEDRSGARRRVEARLVVAADGRGSQIARMAGVPGRVKPHGRFFYWSYWRGAKPAGPRSRMWLLEPDVAYTFPNEDGLTLVLVAPHRDRLPEFRADLEGAYMRMIESLPDAPDLSEATRESKLIGKLDLPNVIRPAARPGLAFVGDAALASDPLWGVGCGWAFQSADWLVEETADALGDPTALDAALDRYRRVHRRRLGPHHAMIADLSTGRPPNAFERRAYRVAARDPAFLREFEAVGSRREPPWHIARPRTLARLLRPDPSKRGN
jgi:flavin-dependent dehydrogenase